MKDHGLDPKSLDWKYFAVIVQQVHWVMRSTLSLSARSCSALGDSGLTSLSPFETRGPQTMQAFKSHVTVWQDVLIGVAKFVNACLQKMNPSFEGQTCDQPAAGVAGRDVI